MTKLEYIFNRDIVPYFFFILLIVTKPLNEVNNLFEFNMLLNSAEKGLPTITIWHGAHDESHLLPKGMVQNFSHSVMQWFQWSMLTFMCQCLTEHEKSDSPDLSRNRFIITSQLFADNSKITAGHILGHLGYFHMTSWRVCPKALTFNCLYLSINLHEVLHKKSLLRINLKYQNKIIQLE